MNYDKDSLESPHADFRSPNSLDRNPRYSDEESGDEDSEIEFSEDSDDDYD